MTHSNDHLDAIMAVMSAAFDPAYGEAWTRRQVEDALLFGNCYYELIGSNGEFTIDNEQTSGFFLSRHGVEEEELLLLAVAPDARGKGLGRRLLSEFASQAFARGAQRLLLEMRRGNPAEALYRSFGFTQIGERRAYYRTPSGERIDAITFTYDNVS